MSVHTSVELSFTDNFEFSEIVRCLTENGWKLDQDGKISFLPVGDNENFDWIEDTLTFEGFKELVKIKEIRSEAVGTHLYKNGIGITLLAFTHSELVVGCDINRVTLPDSDLTDFGFYLNEIAVPLEKFGMKIYRVQCVHYH